MTTRTTSPNIEPAPPPEEDGRVRVTNEIDITLRVIGGKWKPLILHLLQNEGAKRYSEIFRFLEHAPKKTLTAQLRELEADNIIRRTITPSVPVQVSYAVTEHGATLFPVLNAMCDWGHANRHGRYRLTHPTCVDRDAP